MKNNKKKRAGNKTLTENGGMIYCKYVKLTAHTAFK